MSVLILSLYIGGVMASEAMTSNHRYKDASIRLSVHLPIERLHLRSGAALVVDDLGNELFAKGPNAILPIASITKLMTAMVILDSRLPLDEQITVAKADRDLLRLTGSRLRVGSTLTRDDLLTLALMASENRAGAALARTFPGGTKHFVVRMNLKAKLLGLKDTRFVDPTGLDADNVSTARDLARMVKAASRYPKIRAATTRVSLQVRPFNDRGGLRFANTNRLLRNAAWHIELSKTGYINESGRCLVMLTEFHNRSIVLVLLNSFGKLTPMGDANRVRKWFDRGVKNGLDVANGTDAVKRF